MFPLLNRSSIYTCRESGQLCVIILSNRVVRQYRACVVDLLGLGIHVWCVLLYYAYNPSRSCLPSFCAIPILFHFLIFHLLVPSLFKLSNNSRGYSVY